MKKNRFVYILLLFIITSCTENEMLSYKNDPAIYFENDSVAHSFFALNTSVLQDTVLVRVNTMGEVSSQDRAISIIQTNAGKAGAAVAGVHYIPFDNASLKTLVKVPAGKAYADVPVVLIRDASLSLDQVRLELAVASNDNFRPGIDTKRAFIITTTDLALKPKDWDSMWWLIFGSTWGPVKMRFIIDATGYTDWDFFPSSDMSYLFYLRDMAAQKFLEYNMAYPDAPLREANGEIVAISSLI